MVSSMETDSRTGRSAARTAASILTPEPVCVDAEESLDRAMELMEAHAIRHLVVVRDGRVAGVLGDREVLGVTGWMPLRVHESRGPSPTRGHPNRVADAMRAPAAAIEPSLDLRSAIRLLLDEGVDCLPVLDGARLVGIVTETDLLRACLEATSAPGADPPVEELMARDPLSVHWYTTIDEAARLCHRHGMRHLPVLEAGLLVGMLSDRDLRRAHGQGRPGATPVEEVFTRKAIAAAPSMRASEATRVLLENRIGALPVAERGEVRGIVTSTDLLEHGLSLLDTPAP